MAEKTDKRQRILDAALKLFLKTGYDGTAIPPIAKEAGVSVGTIYRYFESKEVLVNELFCETLRGLRHYLEKDYPRNANVKESFYYLFDKIYEYCEENYDKFMFINSTETGYYINMENRERIEEFYSFVFTDLEKFKKQGIVKNLPNKMFIALVYAPIETTLYMQKNGLLEKSEEIFKELRESCWSAVRI